MVVFTCNNCGDSVNKPKVEKHMQYECKRKQFAVSFCCVDCLQDFNQETVKGHCQCVTEDQRYSAKGFVPKSSSEKGKRKQAGWVDIVQSVIERTDLQNDERKFLNIIANFDNVPRKKNKFQNFCFSTAPAYRQKTNLINKVFDMIETEYKAQQIQNTPVKSVKINNIKNENSTDITDKNDLIQEDVQEIKTKECVLNDEKIENEIVNNNIEKKLGKKKKNCSKSIEVFNEFETKLEENIQQSQKKKAKKEKKQLENNTKVVENLELNDTSTKETQLNSAKKSKKIKSKCEVEGSNDISVNANTKTSNKNIIENGITNDNVPLEKIKETQVNLVKMTKKSKKKSNVKESNDINVNGNTSDINKIEIGIINDVPLESIKETQVNSTKKIKKLKNKSEELLLNDINSNTKTLKIDCIENGNHETLEKTESQMSKKEKKEIKKKMKFQHELATVNVVESPKEPLSKKKKRKLNDNEENEEPQQKVIKIETSAQVPEIQNGRKFEWNEAINQILLSKKSKPTSISKVMKRVMNEYHFLNKTTKKTEKELEKIFLKKLKKIKGVLIDNDKVQLVNC